MSLKENDIRPPDLDEGKLKALKEDLERLYSEQDKFVEVNCPACFSSDSSFEFKKYGFKFERCKNCQTVFMNPRATPEILDEFYSNSKLYAYWDKYIFPASRESRMENIFKPRVQYISDLCDKEEIPKDLIVEIGSASGMFCEEALKSKYFKRVLGIEPSAAQVTTCRDLGLEVIESSIENVKNLDEVADVIVSFETIEHISSPRDFILSAHKILKQEGLMILTCPNYLGFDILCLGEDSDSLDAEHINMFNPKSLALLVENLGFSVIEISTPGKLDVDIVMKSFQSNKVSFRKNGFLDHIFNDANEDKMNNFQEFLSKNLLSSHMMIAAKKL